MKVHSGFVSNSSSSSFICVICEREYSGMDADLEDAGMYQCGNGHIFCTRHDPSQPPFSDELGPYGYTPALPIERCPICQFESTTATDIANYYLKKAGVKMADAGHLLKTEFGTYDKLKEFIG